MPSGWKKNVAGLSKNERLGGGDGPRPTSPTSWKSAPRSVRRRRKREQQRVEQSQQAHDFAYAIRCEVDRPGDSMLSRSVPGLSRMDRGCRSRGLTGPRGLSWVEKELAEEARLQGELAKERQRTRQAALERRRCEQRDRELELELGPVVLQKRSLLASGKVDVSASAQGVSVVAFPTPLEKVALVQELRRCHVDGGTTSAESGLSQAEASHNKTKSDIGPKHWPTSVDTQLLALSNQKLRQREPLAALVLVRWATAGFDSTRERGSSLAYTRPKLAKQFRQLEAVATEWLFKHAAYLPLLQDSTLYDEYNLRLETEVRYHSREVHLGWKLYYAQQRLALATAFIPRQATAKCPFGCVLFPLCVVVSVVWKPARYIILCDTGSVDRLVEPTPLGGDDGSPFGLLDRDALERLASYF